MMTQIKGFFCNWIIVIILLAFGLHCVNAEEDKLIERSDDLSKGPSGPSVFYANLIPVEETDPENNEMKDSKKMLIAKRSDINHPQPITLHMTSSTTNHITKRTFRKPIQLFSHLLNFFKSHTQNREMKLPNAEYFLFPGAIRKRDKINKHHALIRRKMRKDGRLETQILSKKFLVNIIRRKPSKVNEASLDKKSILSQKPVMKPGDRRSEFISADDSALGRPDTDAIHPAAFDGINNEEERAMATLKNALHQKSKTQRPEDDHYIMDEDKSLSPQNRHIVEIIEKKKHDKRKLTKLFVHFMEDMAEKLHLNPIAVAGQLVRRIGEKRSHVTSRHKNKRVTVIEDGTYSKVGKNLNDKN